MKKVVFKKFPKEDILIHVSYGGNLEKGAIIVNKCKDPNVRLTITQGTHVLGSYDGRCKVKVSPRTFPNIGFNKKVGYYDMRVVFSKKDYGTYHYSAMGAKINNVKGDGIGADLKRVVFDRMPFSFVTLFKIEEVGYETLIFTNSKVKGMSRTNTSDVSVMNSGGAKQVIELYVRDYIENNALNYFDGEEKKMYVERIAEVEPMASRLFYKGLEANVEKRFEEELAIRGKCTVIGIKDNLMLYI